MARSSSCSGPQGSFRALTLFEMLPPGHVALRVEDDASEPHLHRGEYAIVDTTDRDPVHGELFMVQFSKDGRHYIKQLKADHQNITGRGAAASLVWWVDELRGFCDRHSIYLLVGLWAFAQTGHHRSSRKVYDLKR